MNQKGLKEPVAHVRDKYTRKRWLRIKNRKQLFFIKKRIENSSFDKKI